MEETVYRKQIKKERLMKTVVDSESVERSVKNDEVRVGNVAPVVGSRVFGCVLLLCKSVGILIKSLSFGFHSYTSSTPSSLLLPPLTSSYLLFTSSIPFSSLLFPYHPPLPFSSLLSLLLSNLFSYSLTFAFPFSPPSPLL